MASDDANDDASDEGATRREKPVPPPKERRAAPAGSVGRYRVVERIGQGGMGEVMLARDEQVGRDVAIKYMRDDEPDEHAIQRFLREASIQARLEHPAIVPVHELGRGIDGRPYFVMKKLAGTTLAKILEGDRAGYSRQKLLRTFVDVCLAVEFAHVRGVIHRDLKPENIVLGEFGEVYVLDWGIAKILDEKEGDFADVGATSGSGGHETVAGAAIGTPGYMAPEQVRGLTDIDARADVFALGCLLFEILAGERLLPRGRDGMKRALEEMDARPSVRAPGADLPPELDALCVEATATDRAARLASARALGDRVQQYLDGDRDLAARRELARAHLERARVAFAAADREEPRRTAMREGVRALALDPNLAGAAELVGRLMLEPPRTTPPDVDRAMRADDEVAYKSIARVALWVYLGFLAFMPALWWIAPADTSYVAALSATIAATTVACAVAARPGAPSPNLLIGILNTAIVVLLSRMYTPILIAPGFAALIVTTNFLTPNNARIATGPWLTLMLGSGALLPLILERLGVLTRTISVSAAGVLLHAPAVGANEGPTILVAGVYCASLIVSAAVLASQFSARERVFKRHLHLQAWQLRQLVT